MNKNRPSFLLEQLEPRLLFSADVVLLPVDSPVVGDIGYDVTEVPLSVQTEKTSTFEQLTVIRNEIVFIDASIEDYQLLVEDFSDTGFAGSGLAGTSTILVTTLVTTSAWATFCPSFKASS